jgi:hypothetical protein
MELALLEETDQINVRARAIIPWLVKGIVGKTFFRKVA